MQLWLLIAGLVIVACVVLAIVIMLSRPRRLSSHTAQALRHALARAQAEQDVHRRVLDAEKVLDGAMKKLGFTGSFADKLKKAGPRLRNVQAVWDAHKLRNRIAHEVGIRVDEKQANTAVQAFGKALEELC